MHFLIDFINPQGSIAFTTILDKIKNNLSLIESLKKSVDELKKTKTGPFTSITVYGRWLILYQAIPTSDDETMMYFVDFRIDLDSSESAQVFSQNTLNSFKTLQSRYDSVFQPKHDTAELTYAEPYEKIIKPNFFTCDNDDIVLQKAKALGVLTAIENLNDKETIRVGISDEKITIDKKTITNLYAIMHLGGNENQNDNGYIYLKIYDLANNFDKVDDLEIAINGAGGNFDRGFFMERFDTTKLN